ncbi:MAG: hypothetical protein HYZ73_00715 [Elusimicrobia bacterium]|nr:hypothetical protein [Elusimicrobiota bacterium]
MPHVVFFLFIMCCSFLAGCRGEGIQTYRIPKEPPPLLGEGMVTPQAQRDIDWTAPTGWKEQAPSAMRVGSFLVPGEDGMQADVSVVPLSGEAGGDLANINRWRGQLNLEPITEAELSVHSQTITPAGRRMRWVEFVSRESLIGRRYKKRLIVAIFTQGERTWFFKMTGEDAAVQAAKPSFVQFLRSLRFHSHE